MVRPYSGKLFKMCNIVNIRFICIITLLIILMSLFTPSVYALAQAGQAQIQGDYCYQYGDSESLMIAKEISYAMALRKAIEAYKTFISSTSIVKDFKLKKDIIEAIAAGYVDNIKIIKQDVKGRMVCTTLIGYVNPNAVKSIISRKVERARKTKRKEFKGILSNDRIKILNIKKYTVVRETWELGDLSPGARKLVEKEMENQYQTDLKLHSRDIEILYQAKRDIGHNVVKIIVDCFDKDGTPIEGTAVDVPYNGLKIGEVRRIKITLPRGTVSYEIRLRNN